MKDRAKLQWFRFHVAAWKSDERLRLCSLAARGLWIEMLGLMWSSEDRGSLLVFGSPPSDAELAVLVSATVDEVRESLAELERRGVFSRRKNGVIFSRKMVRDENFARKAAEDGQKGGRKSKARERARATSYDQTLDPHVEGRVEGGVGPRPKTSDPRPEKNNPSLRSGSSVSRSDPDPAGRASPEFDLGEEHAARKAADIRRVEEARRRNGVLAEAFSHFGEVAAAVGWTVPRTLSDARKAKLWKRIGDAGGLDAWRAQISAAGRVGFLTGDNAKGWKADFDWLLSEGNFLKVLEGKYANRARPRDARPMGAAEQALAMIAGADPLGRDRDREPPFRVIDGGASE